MGFVRCGICDMNFKSNDEWVRHSETDLHKQRVARYFELVGKHEAGNPENCVVRIRKEITGAFKFR